MSTKVCSRPEESPCMVVKKSRNNQNNIRYCSERFQECNGNVATEANLETQERIMVQNKELQEKVVKMEEQMAALVGAVTNISAKLDSTKL